MSGTGMYMRTADWLDVLAADYLQDFVSDGGAAVRFVVPFDDASREAVTAGLNSLSTSRGYQFASVDAAETKIHMMDRVLHAIAQQLNWRELAAAVGNELLEAEGYRAPPAGTGRVLEELAAAQGVPVSEIRLALRQSVSREILRNHDMALEFRTGMARLCQFVLDRGWVNEPQAEAIEQWLRGELRGISALRPVDIYQRITRHNARQMLLSLPCWLRLAGMTGLVLHLDVRRLAVKKPRRASQPLPVTDDTTGDVFYSRPAVLEAFELLRQLVDNTDELRHALVVVTADPQFLDEGFDRSVSIYPALKNRIWDDVRDKRRPNPASSLVRLSANAEPMRPQYIVSVT